MTPGAPRQQLAHTRSPLPRMQSLTYGSEALLGGVNAVTPHWAGAVDIVAVRQKDGTLKSSPFYVRFGKYQTFSRNRRVKIVVNGAEMDFGLELGQYGSALFSHEQEEPLPGTLSGPPHAPYLRAEHCRAPARCQGEHASTNRAECADALVNFESARNNSWVRAQGDCGRDSGRRRL